MALTGVGIYAGNSGSGSVPAHTAVADYFTYLVPVVGQPQAVSDTYPVDGNTPLSVVASDGMLALE